MAPVPRSPEAEALELPELDKEDDAREVDVGSFELSLVDEPDVAQDADSTLDTFEIDIQLLSDSGDSEAASELDVGVSELIGSLPEPALDPEGDGPTSSVDAADELDPHLEAPLASDEPSSSDDLENDGLEPLPELAREDLDTDDGPELEGALLASAPEGALESGSAYACEELVLGAPCNSLWAGHGCVLCAGEKLWRFVDQRQTIGLPRGARVVSLALLESGSVICATTRGLLELSPDGRWSTLPEPARDSGSDVVELAAPSGERALWARLSGGLLLRRRAEQWERCETGGDVRALGSEGGHLALLVLAQQPTLQLSDDAGSSLRELLLPEPARSVALGSAPLLASQGPVLALCDATRGLCVSGDGGQSFRLVTGAVNVTALCIGKHEGAPAVFAALYREGGDRSEVVVVDPSNGRAARVAELSGDPEDDGAEETGRTQALRFFDGWLWACGGYGLTRLRG